MTATRVPAAAKAFVVACATLALMGCGAERQAVDVPVATSPSVATSGVSTPSDWEPGSGFANVSENYAASFTVPPGSLKELRRLGTVVVRARVGEIVHWKTFGEPGTEEEWFAWKLKDVHVLSGKLVDPIADVLVPLTFPTEGVTIEQALADYNRDLPTGEAMFFLYSMTMPPLDAQPKPGTKPATEDDARYYMRTHAFALLVEGREPYGIQAPISDATETPVGFLTELAKFPNLNALVDSL